MSGQIDENCALSSINRGVCMSPFSDPTHKDFFQSCEKMNNIYSIISPPSI